MLKRFSQLRKTHTLRNYAWFTQHRSFKIPLSLNLDQQFMVFETCLLLSEGRSTLWAIRLKLRSLSKSKLKQSWANQRLIKLIKIWHNNFTISLAPNKMILCCFEEDSDLRVSFGSQTRVLVQTWERPAGCTGSVSGKLGSRPFSTTQIFPANLVAVFSMSGSVYSNRRSTKMGNIWMPLQLWPLLQMNKIGRRKRTWSFSSGSILATMVLKIVRYCTMHFFGFQDCFLL